MITYIVVFLGKYERKKEKAMKKKIIAIMLASMLAVSATACGGSGAPTSDTQNTTPEETEPEYVSETEISDVFANPDDYKGKYIKLSGKIFSGPDKADGYTAYQAWHDPKNSEMDFVFGIADSEEDCSIDDYVVVDGQIVGTFEGTSVIGATIECPQIDAVSIEKQSYMDAVVPTVKELVPENAVSEQNGVSLKVDKIEFADAETRVYVTATNSSSDKFSLFTYSIMLVQNGQQIEQEYTNSIYEGDYPELSSDILPNASSSGILVFPAMDSTASFQLYAEGMSDNYDLDFSPFTIDISAQ